MTHERFRILASTASGTMVEVVQCLEHEIDATHDRLLEIPSVRHVVTIGPFTYRGKSCDS